MWSGVNLLLSLLFYKEDTMVGLEFGKVATNLDGTVTPADKEFAMIVARTDGTVTYKKHMKVVK